MTSIFRALFLVCLLEFVAAGNGRTGMLGALTMPSTFFGKQVLLTDPDTGTDNTVTFNSISYQPTGFDLAIYSGATGSQAVGIFVITATDTLYCRIPISLIDILNDAVFKTELTAADATWQYYRDTLKTTFEDPCLFPMERKLEASSIGYLGISAALMSSCMNRAKGTPTYYRAIYAIATRLLDMLNSIDPTLTTVHGLGKADNARMQAMALRQKPITHHSDDTGIHYDDTVMEIYCASENRPFINTPAAQVSFSDAILVDESSSIVVYTQALTTFEENGFQVWAGIGGC
ncbi:uncharacterized protein N7459_007908 [Penicillium hispanicum]|uniref:uncharacterized protein n=1 Tax=Penicillium hispanicum TaxID=1080232 RepID=UPI0025415199|nr:uncharacterized protein N7459_007908 [Penicillium hispanicum]KAJ5573481.1 hypothetical protein N7459_007908 [Penicillium hispanicum]